MVVAQGNKFHRGRRRRKTTHVTRAHGVFSIYSITWMIIQYTKTKLKTHIPCAIFGACNKGETVTKHAFPQFAPPLARKMPT